MNTAPSSRIKGKRCDNINELPKKPSSYGDKIAEVLVFLVGVVMFVVLVVYR